MTLNHPMHLRAQGQTTIHQGHHHNNRSRTLCGIELDLLGTNAAHLEPDLDITCTECRNQPNTTETSN